ncbi:MAG TPA: xanthine dehydrogenase family protein subunit M [Dehalococcoidia bacterium]|nr:xanthine dehydrogenase family protein subunit M [Dehalococcoidia bacterium]
MRPFRYHAPATLDEAVALLHELGEAGRPIAGGTDIVVQMKEGHTRFPYPDMIVGLGRIPGLQEIEFSDKDGLRIGAAATMADVAASEEIRARYRALAEGAGVVGSLQTMNMGTVGGNVCNAAPSADTAPALLAFEAEAVVVSPSGRRAQPLHEFFVGPGKTTLKPGEILTELRLPAPPAHTGSAYVRHTPRKQMDIAVVGVAVALTLSGDTIQRARVALGAVAPTPVRAPRAEAALEGQKATAETFAKAAAAAMSDCSPISDVRGSAEFRRHLVRVLTERMLALAATRARG